MRCLPFSVGKGLTFSIVSCIIFVLIFIYKSKLNGGRGIEYQRLSKIYFRRYDDGTKQCENFRRITEKMSFAVFSDDLGLDLGCGRGLTSLVIAKETGAKFYADDLWINADENRNRFIEWGIDKQVIPVRQNANNFNFEEKQFNAVFSIDSYHYFAGNKGFFENKIMPFIKDGGIVLISIPGIKDEFEGRSDEILSDWLGEDSYMFKSPKLWKEIIGNNGRIDLVKTWEMKCSNMAWSEWLTVDNDFADCDRKHYDSIIRPYTCFVGIEIRLK